MLSVDCGLLWQTSEHRYTSAEREIYVITDLCLTHPLAGATEVTWQQWAPETLDDRSARPSDEDLVLLACRRTTFEWVLRRAAMATDPAGTRVRGTLRLGSSNRRIVPTVLIRPTAFPPESVNQMFRSGPIARP